MTTYFLQQQGRVHFGSLPPRPVQARTPHAQALDAIGVAIPALEKQLGFALGGTVQLFPEGLLRAEVLLPDQHYSLEAILHISDALQAAVRPYGVELDVVPDSDAPYGE